MKRSLLTVVLSGVLTLPAVRAVAQELGDAPDQGVARISLLSGDVTVQRGDSGEVIEAEMNAPLVARDHLITGMNARAEIQLDWANMLRLASGSEVRMADLQDRRYRVELNEGMITLRNSGLRKVKEGVTTIEEIVRETVK